MNVLLFCALFPLYYLISYLQQFILQQLYNQTQEHTIYQQSLTCVCSLMHGHLVCVSSHVYMELFKSVSVFNQIKREKSVLVNGATFLRILYFTFKLSFATCDDLIHLSQL